MNSLVYFRFHLNIGMLGMYVGVFEDEEDDKAGFRSLRPSCMPNFGQKPVFGHVGRPKNVDFLVSIFKFIKI